MTHWEYLGVESQDISSIRHEKKTPEIRQNVALRLPKRARNVPNVFVGWNYIDWVPWNVPNGPLGAEICLRERLIFFSVRPNADFGAVTASIRFFNGFHSYRGSKVTKNHEKNSGFPKDEGNPIIMGFQGEKKKKKKMDFQKMKETLL